MTDWNKLCEEMDNMGLKYGVNTVWIQVKAVGDEMQFKLNASQEALGKVFNKLADEQKKLEAIRVIVAEYPKCDKNGLAFDWDELITRILAVLDGPAQNTDYVQKEKTQ